MHPQPSPTSVIMVHYGDPKETAQALQALWQGTHTPAEIIIIDHAEEALMLPIHPQQKIIRPQVNAGYAAGLNIGFGILFARNPKPDEVIVCMNNDVHVSPHTVERVYTYFSREATPVIVGARWGRIHPLTGRSTLLPASHGKPAAHPSLTYLDGAFFASTWAVWLKLQKIPDEYFMYWEESALAARARRCGIRQYVLSDLDISHDDTPDTASSSRRTYYLVRNGAQYMQTNTPLPLRWWWRIYNRVRYVYHSLRRNKQSPLIRRALADAIRGVEGRADFLL